MNRVGVFTFLLIFTFSTIVKAQDSDVFQFMAEHLTSVESSSITRAKKSLQQGDNLDSKIKAEDKKIEKYFKKKRKRKKAEKKSVDVKKLRIQQAVYYNKGYATVFSTYLDKLNACSFYYPEDKSRVDLLLEEAKSLSDKASRTVTNYKKKDKKALKKKVAYQKLKSDLQGVVDNYVAGIDNLIKAYSIYLDQELKKQAEEEENRAWQNAESDNTIHSYQAYLNTYSNGKHSEEARSRVQQLRNAQSRSLEGKLKGELVYRVQIAASRYALKRSVIARFYRNTREVKTMNYDDWYKYSVGSFKKYAEAKAFVRKVRVTGAFVVAYLDDKKIDITRAIAGEK